MTKRKQSTKHNKEDDEQMEQEEEEEEQQTKKQRTEDDFPSKDDIVWKPLTIERMTELSTAFYTDVPTRKAYAAKIQALFKGPVVIIEPNKRKKQQEKQQEPEEPTDEEKEEADRLNRIWTKCGIQITASVKKFGFAVGMVREEEPDLPIIIDLELLEIELYRHYDGRKIYKLKRRIASRQQAKDDEESRILKNTIIFEYPDQEPSADGTFRSVMTAILPGIEHEEILTKANAKGWATRANPNYVVQYETTKANKEDVESPGWGDNVIPGVANGGASIPIPLRASTLSREQIRQVQSVVEHTKFCTQNGISSDQALEIAVRLQKESALKAKADVEVLPRGTILVTAPIPEPPGQHLLDYMIQREEVVFELMGAPCSRSSSSKSGKSTGGSSSSSSGESSTPAVSPESDKRFNESIKFEKNVLIGFMKQMWHFMHDARIRQAYRQEVGLANFDQHEEDKRVDCVDIQILSLPETADIAPHEQKIHYNEYIKLIAANLDVSVRIFRTEDQYKQALDEQQEREDGPDEEEGVGEEEKEGDTVEEKTVQKTKNATGTKETVKETKRTHVEEPKGTGKNAAKNKKKRDRKKQKKSK